MKPLALAAAALALLVLGPAAALPAPPLLDLPDALAPMQYGLGLIGAPAAWALADGAGVRVAVLDSGVDHAHLDLLPRVDLLGGTSVARPYGTYARLPLGPWNTTQDTGGHGTLVSGVVAAERGNVLGVAGVSRATIVPVKVDDLGVLGDLGMVAQGIHAALDRGARVVHMSLGASVTTPELDAALARAEAEGAVVVASSGNDGGTRPTWPAASPTVIGVGAVDAAAEPWAMNNQASADLAAPGVDVWSTFLGNTYAPFTGTSLAAPHVSGVAALMLDSCPALAPAEVRALLYATAQDVGPPGFDGGTGWGLVRADRALAAALAACP